MTMTTGDHHQHDVANYYSLNHEHTRTRTHTILVSHFLLLYQSMCVDGARALTHTYTHKKQTVWSAFSCYFRTTTATTKKNAHEASVLIALRKYLPLILNGKWPFNNNNSFECEDGNTANGNSIKWKRVCVMRVCVWVLFCVLFLVCHFYVFLK